jgi:starch-binding outer membrane protein, SusD/RagB family
MHLSRFKHTFTTAALVAVLHTGLFSCKTELLSPVPETLFSDQVVYDTPDRILLQVNGLYQFMKSGSFLGGRYQVYGDIRANDFLNRTNNGVTGLGVWGHTLTETSSNDVTNMWNSAYAAINQINVFLQGLDDNSAKFVAPVFPDNFSTTATQYRAEARFLRGLAYYSLLQYYARPFADGNGSKPGLPLRLLAEKSSLNNNMARSTVAEIYAQIITDLNFAEQNLPLTYSTATLRVTRAHRNSAIALKSRVYLSMGDYAKVITEANKIVPATAPFVATSGVPHALSPSVLDVFVAPQETVESIFSFAFSAQNTPGTQNQLGFYYQSPKQGGGGEYGLNAAGIVANTAKWPATDARRGFVYNDGSDLFLYKYRGTTPFLDKAPVIRYAEVLLNLAEAKVRTSNSVDAGAIALLNAVRGRSDASMVSKASDFASSTDLINAILLERRIEFLGEGLRNNDLMRLLQPIPAKGSVVSVAPAEVNYIWPIPAAELEANKLMTRNDR